MKCPNKNLQEYKDLAKKHGEKDATYYWVKHDGDLNRIKENISFGNYSSQYKTDNLGQLLKDITERNKNNTVISKGMDIINHYFEANKDNLKYSKTLEYNLPENVVGKAGENGTFGINFRALHKNYSGKELTAATDSAIVHELLHLVTINGLKENKEFNKNISEIFNEFKDKNPNAKSYGFQNEQEFIAEVFSNKDFAETINNTEKDKSILHKIIDAFLNMLGIHTDSNTDIIKNIILRDNPLKQNYLENKNKPKGETIYFHKTKELDYNEKDLHDKIKKELWRNVMHNENSVNDIVTKDKLDGKHTIKHTRFRNEKAEQRKKIVEENIRKLERRNKNATNEYGEKPFIIKELPDTITNEKDANGEFIKIHNRSVEINPSYLDTEWEKFKVENEQDDENPTSMFITQNIHNPFSNEYIESYQKEIGLSSTDENLNDLNTKVAMLQNAFRGSTVKFNADLPDNVYGRVKGKDVELNPRKVKDDTVIHEFGHIFIDSLGGMSNNFIKRGRRLLKGSKVEKEVSKNYDNIDQETLDKEILATAIGREGADLYNLKKESPFKAWLKIFFNKIKLMFHIGGSVALDMANQMLTNNIKEYNKQVTYSKSWQYSKVKEHDNILDKKDDIKNWFSTIKNLFVLRNDFENSDIKKGEISNIEKMLEDKNSARNILDSLYSKINPTKIGSRIKQDELLKAIDNIKKNKDIIKGLTKDGKTVDVDSGDEYEKYINIITGKTYERVSKEISNSEFPEKKLKGESISDFENRLRDLGKTESEIYQAKLVNSSTEIGTKIDSIVRDFFDKGVKDYSKYNISSKEIFDNFIDSLKELKKRFDANNETVISNGIVVYDDRSGIAGTLDILTYTNDGRIHIYDMKSMRGENFKDEHFGIKYDSKTAFEMSDDLNDKGKPDYTVIKGKTIDSKREKHQKQLSAYNIALNNTFGIAATSINVIPIEVNYESGETKTSKLDLKPIIKLEKLSSVGNIKFNASKTRKNISLSKEEKSAYDSIIKIRNHVEKPDNKRNEESFDNDTISVELKELKRKLLDRMIILRNKYKYNKNEKFKEGIENIITELEKNNNIDSLNSYINEALKQASRLQKRLSKLSDENRVDADILNKIRVYIGAFDMLSDIRREVKRLYDLKQIDKKTRKEFYKKINKSENKLNAVKSQYELLQDDVIADTVMKHSTRVEYTYRLRFGRQFNVENANGKISKVEKEKYINNKLDEYKEEIYKHRLEYARSIVKKAKGDISAVELWAVDPKNLDDEYVATTIKLLENSDYKTNHSFIDKRNKIYAIYKKLKDYKGGESDQQKLYDEIIEKVNGKRTNHYVGKYLSTMQEDLSKLYEKHKDELDENGRLPYKIWKEFNDSKSSYINPQWIALQEMDRDNPVRAMYDAIMDLNKQKDESVNPNYRLALYEKELYSEYSDNADRINEVTYRMPSIEKTTIERSKEQGPLVALKEGIRDAFVKDTNYIESGADSDVVANRNLKGIIVDEKGEEAKIIPLHYRNRLKKDDQQSYDIVSVALQDFYNVENFKNKDSVKGILEVMRERFKSRDVEIKRGGKWLSNIFGSEESIYSKKGIDTNIYKALQSLIDNRLYGITTIDMGDVQFKDKSISYNKLARLIMNWTGGVMLKFNKIAGINNLMQGKYQNFLESVANNHFGLKNIRHAEGLYTKDIFNMLADMNRYVPMSKTNLLIEYFDAFADFEGLRHHFSDDNITKRLLNTGVGYAYSNMGEHYIQGTAMYSVLDNIKVKTADGEQIPLHKAYEVINGKLVLKKGIKIDSDFETQVGIKIKEVIKQLHGNYDKRNQAMLQRYVSGKFVFMLRKWIVAGTQRRWRGLGKAFNKDMDISYNHFLQENAEGYYATAVRIGFAKLKKIFIKDIDNLQQSLTTTKWSELTDLEKGNIKKTVIDFATKSLLLAMASMFAGLAKGALTDDDKDLFYTLAYYSRRQYSEIAFYSDVGQGLKVLQTPFASINILQKTGELVDLAMSNPSKRYIRGPHAGELKIKRKTYKVLPILSQVDRSVREMYKWLSRPIF